MCDICDQYVALGSLMQFGDYSQTRFCGNCAPDFLRSVAAMVAGETEPAACAVCDKLVPDEWVPDHAAFHALERSAEQAAADQASWQPAGGDDDPAAAAAATEDADAKPDHWAGTKTVKRSTHGHRTPRAAATGKSREDMTE